MDILLDTVRDEIASCVEKAYERISVPEVTRMLFLDAPKLLAGYASKVRTNVLSCIRFFDVGSGIQMIARVKIWSFVG